MGTEVRERERGSGKWEGEREGEASGVGDGEGDRKGRTDTSAFGLASVIVASIVLYIIDSIAYYLIV